MGMNFEQSDIRSEHRLSNLPCQGQVPMREGGVGEQLHGLQAGHRDNDIVQQVLRRVRGEGSGTLSLEAEARQAEALEIVAAEQGHFTLDRQDSVMSVVA